MKTLYRILRASFAVLCLLLFVATALLWFRSRTNLDEFFIYRPRSFHYIWSVEGRIYLNRFTARVQYWGESSMGFGGGELSRLKYGHVPFSHQLGPFGYASVTAPPRAFGASGFTVMFPHWALLLLFSVPPALGCAVSGNSALPASALPRACACAAATTSAPPPSAAPNAAWKKVPPRSARECLHKLPRTFLFSPAASARDNSIS